MSNIEVRIADWNKDNADLRRIRKRVFIDEQGATPEQEWDSLDADAIHFLAEEDDLAVGTARQLPDGCSGRVPVRKEWRGLKVGEALMQAAIAEPERRGLKH